MTAPVPVISVLDLETLMDALGYLLSTDDRTKNIHWILGDVGMGAPGALPFGYISQVTENVTWYTTNGNGLGGLAAGGPRGLDDWNTMLQISVCTAPHSFHPPIAADPPDTSPFFPATIEASLTYTEQPGWREGLRLTQDVKKVLRTNATVLSAATDTRIVESRYLVMEIGSSLFRAQRLTIQAQQRRVRGN